MNEFGCMLFGIKNQALGLAFPGPCSRGVSTPEPLPHWLIHFCILPINNLKKGAYLVYPFF
jgi:hypothetical protein